ncbi:hypothetical protein [Clostridium thailandense]|uniref:hypothetical protein n=1 Tax=Clostridium thailandense TaxID=2794346 RepID=UPI003989D77D
MFEKVKIINCPIYMNKSDIKKCIDLLGKDYTKIKCNIYFINNEIDFKNYAKDKLEDSYYEYKSGSLHGLCCSESSGASTIFVFIKNTISSYGVERCYYQKSILRVLYHELRHAYQHKELNLPDYKKELDADMFAAKIMQIYDKEINEIFKNYELYK